MYLLKYLVKTIKLFNFKIGLKKPRTVPIIYAHREF